ncbi:MAG: GntR family transcriptional regulator, partial [Terrimicrobiaceae bacterium]|nr:GntR family transcriptional regulator [Terrimicrobiaceae bacterium]
MYLSIHPSSGVPIYRQVFQQLRERIASGQLAAGEQLPSVRDLSAEVKVNPLTIAKVYQFLEREGLVETRRGQGTFVARGLKRASPAERRRQLEPALRQLVAEALHLGLDEEE